jgi:hypothetical protein
MDGGSAFGFGGGQHGGLARQPLAKAPKRLILLALPSLNVLARTIRSDFSAPRL